MFPTLVDAPAREPRESRERSNKIPWAERPERPERLDRPERRERLERQERQERQEQGAPPWSGRSWYNGGAFGAFGAQGSWRGSSKGNNVGPKGKGTLGSGYGPPAGAGYEPREVREGKGLYVGKDGKGRAEGKGTWQ